jgi:hypothetical protein
VCESIFFLSIYLFQFINDSHNFTERYRTRQLKQNKNEQTPLASIRERIIRIDLPPFVGGEVSENFCG